MINRFFATAVLLFLGLIYSITAAQEPLRNIEIEEVQGFQTVTVPMISFQKDGTGSIEIVGQGQINSLSQQIKFKIESNKSTPRKGVTHTEKSCIVSIDEKLFHALAEHLSVNLPSSVTVPKSHAFDLLEVEGSLHKTTELPVKLEIIDLVHDDFYSEWYVVFDVARRKILLSEKSNHYREPFITTFLR